MLKARKTFLCLALMLSMGVAARAQLFDLSTYLFCEGCKLCIEAGVTIGYWTIVGGARVFKAIKNSSSDYPELKLGVNCFGITNVSNEPWKLQIPNAEDKSEKSNPDLEKIKKQAGDVKVYRIEKEKTDKKVDKPKIESIDFLGDMHGKKRKIILINPGDTLILYTNVPKIAGYKYDDLRLEFRFIDSAGGVIKYDMFIDTKHEAPISFKPKPKFATAAENSIEIKQAEVKDKKNVKRIMYDYAIKSDLVAQ